MSTRRLMISVLILLILAALFPAAESALAQGQKATRDLVYEEEEEAGGQASYSLEETSKMLKEARERHKGRKFAEAVQLYERALPSAIALTKVDHPAVIEAQMYLGDCYLNTGRLQRAVKYLRPIVEKRVKPLAADQYKIYHCVGLMALAAALNNTGDPQAAAELVPLVFEPIKRLEGPKSPQLMKAFKLSAKSAGLMGERAEAADMYRQIVDLEKAIYGPTDLEPVATSLTLAEVLIEGGQAEEALKIYQDNAKILKQPKAHQLVVMLNLNAYGSALLKLGRPADGLTKYEESMAILEKLGQRDGMSAASLMNDMASAYSRLGKPARALELTEESMAIHRRRLGLENDSTIGVALNLAGRYQDLNRYDEALELLAEVLPVVEKTQGDNSRRTITARLAQTSLWSSLGEYDRARDLAEKNLAIAEKSLGPDAPQVLRIYHNLASIYSGRDDPDYNKAIEYLTRIAESNLRTKGAEHPETISSQLNCALMLINVNDYKRSEAMYREQLPRAKQVFGQEHPTYLTAQLNYGVLYRYMKQYDRSAEIIEALLPDIKASGDERDYMTAASHLSRTLREAGQVDKAAFYSSQAVESGQRIRQQLRRAPLDTRKAFAKRLTNVYQGLADILMQQNKIAEAQEVMSLLKVDELADLAPPAGQGDLEDSPAADSGALLAGVPPDIARRYQEISGNLAALGEEQRALLEKRKSGETLSAKEEQRLKDLRRDMTAARKVFTTFAAGLSEEMAKSGDRPAADLSNLETYQRLLGTMGEGTVLLQTILTDDRLWLILTTPNTLMAKESPLDVKTLPSKVSRFRDVLQDPDADARPLAREFYQAVIGPVAQALKQAGARTIMLSLDGQLRYIPMAALYDGKRWLVQDYRLALFNDAAKAGLAVPPVGNWQVAGLGVTKGHTVKVGNKRGSFSALPAVKDELTAIVKTKSNQAGVLPGTMTLDEGFTGDALAEVLEAGYPVVHLASHFHFDAKDPEKSFLLLGDGSGLPLSQIETEDYKFKNVDLLALSACQTARGGVDATGREIEGFGALAQKRGAKAVLATLWPVFDESTGMLMSNFYRLHADENKPSLAESLQQAQLMMIENKIKGKDFRHPFYWAPFVLMGDWR